MGPNSYGYVIVKSISGGKIVALSGNRKMHKPKFIERPSLSGCFVHPQDHIREAVRTGEDWTRDANFAYKAYWDPGVEKGKDRTVIMGIQMRFEELLKQLGLTSEGAAA